MNHLRAFVDHINSGAILLLSTPLPVVHGVPVATIIIAHPIPPRANARYPFIKPASPAYPKPIIIRAPRKQIPVNPKPATFESVIASLPTRLGNFRAISGTVIIQSMYLY